MSVDHEQKEEAIDHEVRTLFVSGLPMDAKPREVYLLFRSCAGYQGSFLKLISSRPGKPPQPIAFVSFKTRKQAEEALKQLQGVKFDPTCPQSLRLEFAHTNSRSSPDQQQQNSSLYYHGDNSTATTGPVAFVNIAHPSQYSCNPNLTGSYLYLLPNTCVSHVPSRSHDQLFDLIAGSQAASTQLQLQGNTFQKSAYDTNASQSESGGYVQII